LISGPHYGTDELVEGELPPCSPSEAEASPKGCPPLCVNPFVTSLNSTSVFLYRGLIPSIDPPTWSPLTNCDFSQAAAMRGFPFALSRELLGYPQLLILSSCLTVLPNLRCALLKLGLVSLLVVILLFPADSRVILLDTYLCPNDVNPNPHPSPPKERPYIQVQEYTVHTLNVFSQGRDVSRN